MNRERAGQAYISPCAAGALAVVCVLLGVSAHGQRAGRPAPITVAVAANAAPVIGQLAAEFEKASSYTVVLSSGATGLLARQAREGAPFDLFVSADMATVRKLADEKVIDGSTVAPYAQGRLCLWQDPKSRPQVLHLAEIARPGASKLRIAIANPETAPYGAAAKQALARSGIELSSLKGRLIYGQDVRQTRQFVDTGNADLAFVSRSLVVPGQEHGIEVPPQLYDPIVQGLGIMAGAKDHDAAAAFRGFLLSTKAAHVFHEHGYLPPQDPGGVR